MYYDTNADKYLMVVVCYSLLKSCSLHDASTSRDTNQVLPGSARQISTGAGRVIPLASRAAAAAS